MPSLACRRWRRGLRPCARTRALPPCVSASCLRRPPACFRASLCEARPATVLEIETGPHSYLIRLLRDGGIDLMIGRMPAATDMAGHSFAHLYEEGVVLVVRHGHPLSRSPVAEVLATAPVILPPEGALIRSAVDDYLASLGLLSLRPAFETVALAVGRGILAGSDAVWFISRGVVAEELDRGDLVEVPTGARYLSGSVGITRRQADSDLADLDLMVRLCHAEAASAG
jgi:LysR family transcriptional regulator, pca operon transcriptional activator